jgi:hypothetical protein
METNHIWKKLQEALQIKFHGDAKIVEVMDNSFSYDLFKNNKIALWQVRYIIDKSGLNIDWENMWIVKAT